MTTIRWEFNENSYDFTNATSNSFKYMNTNSNVLDTGTNFLNVNDSSNLVYVDLNSEHNANSSYTIDFTVKDLDDSTSNVNYLTFGYHTRGHDTGSITVGKSNNKYALGVITNDSTVKSSPSTSSNIFANEFVKLRLIHDVTEYNEDKLRLYRVIDESTSEMVCNGSNLPHFDYSIPDAKLILGTSGWVNETGYNNTFDVANVVFSNIEMTLNNTIFPKGSGFEPTATHIGYFSSILPNEVLLTKFNNTLQTFYIKIRMENYNESANPLLSISNATIESVINDGDHYTYKISISTVVSTINDLNYSITIEGESTDIIANTTLSPPTFDNVAPSLVYKPTVINSNQIQFQLSNVFDDGNNNTNILMNSSMMEEYTVTINAFSNDILFASNVITNPNGSDTYTISGLESETYYMIKANITDFAGNTSNDILPVLNSGLLTNYTEGVFRTEDVTSPSNNFSIAINDKAEASTSNAGITLSFENMYDSYTDSSNALNLYYLVSNSNVSVSSLDKNDMSNIKTFTSTSPSDFNIDLYSYFDGFIGDPEYSINLGETYNVYAKLIDSHDLSTDVETTFVINQSNTFISATTDFTDNSLASSNNNLIIQWKSKYNDTSNNFNISVFDTPFTNHASNTENTTNWYATIPLSGSTQSTDTIEFEVSNDILFDETSTNSILYLQNQATQIAKNNATITTNKTEIIFENLSDTFINDFSIHSNSFYINLNLSNIDGGTQPPQKTFTDCNLEQFSNIGAISFTDLLEGATYQLYLSTSNILGYENNDIKFDSNTLPIGESYINFQTIIDKTSEGNPVVRVKSGQTTSSNVDEDSKFKIYMAAFNESYSQSQVAELFDTDNNTLRTVEFQANAIQNISNCLTLNDDSLFSDSSPPYLNIQKYYNSNISGWNLHTITPSNDQSNVFVWGMLKDAGGNKVFKETTNIFDYSIDMNTVILSNVTHNDNHNKINTSNTFAINWNTSYSADNTDFDINVFNVDISSTIQSNDSTGQSWTAYLSNIDLSSYDGSNVRDELTFNYKDIDTNIVVSNTLVVDTTAPTISFGTVVPNNTKLTVPIQLVNDISSNHAFNVNVIASNATNGESNNVYTDVIFPSGSPSNFDITNLESGLDYQVSCIVTDIVGNSTSPQIALNASKIFTVDDSNVQITIPSSDFANTSTRDVSLSNITVFDAHSDFNVAASLFATDFPGDKKNVLRSSSESNITVTVNGNNKFVFDPIPAFKKDITYKFDLSDSSLSTHPLAFRNTADGSDLTTVTGGAAGTSGSFVEYTPSSTGDAYVACETHGSGMGSYYNPIYVSENNVYYSNDIPRGTQHVITDTVLDGYYSSSGYKRVIDGVTYALGVFGIDHSTNSNNVINADKTITIDTIITGKLITFDEGKNTGGLMYFFNYDNSNAMNVINSGGENATTTSITYEEGFVNKKAITLNSNVSITMNDNRFIDNNMNEFTFATWFKYSSNLESTLLHIDDNHNISITNNTNIKVEWKTGGSNDYITSLAENKWYHLTSTINSSTLNTYLNSELLTSVATSITPTFTDIISSTRYSPFVIGSNLEGALDDTRIYTRTLSQEDVYDLYNIGGKYIHFRFEETSGSDVYDSSGHDFNAESKGTVSLSQYDTDHVVGNNSFKFNGGNYVELDGSQHGNLDVNQMTISTWLKISDLEKQADAKIPIVMKNDTFVFGLSNDKVYFDYSNYIG